MQSKARFTLDNQIFEIGSALLTALKWQLLVARNRGNKIHYYYYYYHIFNGNDDSEGKGLQNKENNLIHNENNAN